MENERKTIEFTQQGNSNGGFLQSENWRKFQESVGRKTHFIGNDGFSASIIEHELPIVGKYFYVPRGPVMKHGTWSMKQKSGMRELVELAKKESAGWIRIEPESQEILEIIRENVGKKILKAPHDVQPKEIFVLDISKDTEKLLSEMKSKTRYNIKLAQKHNVLVQAISKQYVESFLELTKEMAARQGITAHPEEYYRKMIESFPEDILKIYIAKYEGETIAANLVLFFGDTATYLHGASSNEHRNVMAPFLLQWQAILDAKERGCAAYDFGGVKTKMRLSEKNTWEGITNFKFGFSPQTKPIEFPGSYDIIVNPRKYAVYKGLQRAKAMLHKFHK